MKDNQYAIYTGVYEIDGNLYTCSLLHFDTFKNGFWVTENFEFTFDDDDKKYWIPPHAIKYVLRDIKDIDGINS